MDWKKNLQRKVSAVDRNMSLNQKLINGVIFRACRPVCHEDGFLTEVIRSSWPEFNADVVQTHITTTLPSRIRAWGLHEYSADRLFVVKGIVSIIVFDCRPSSTTYGLVNEFKVSEKSPGLLFIPPNLFHGWKVIGNDEAYIINMPTIAYKYENPDSLDLPYESEKAKELIPWRW